jgi:branched-chain amino acid transport system substrate-binding protein
MVGWGKGYSQAKPVLVGAPVPRASAYGQNGERGMILAAEEINAAGGIKIGKTMHPLQLEIIDTVMKNQGFLRAKSFTSKINFAEEIKCNWGGPACRSAVWRHGPYAKYKILDILIGCYTPDGTRKWPLTQ